VLAASDRSATNAAVSSDRIEAVAGTVSTAPLGLAATVVGVGSGTVEVVTIVEVGDDVGADAAWVVDDGAAPFEPLLHAVNRTSDREDTPQSPGAAISS
jgi:hypothetical protein